RCGRLRPATPVPYTTLFRSRSGSSSGSGRRTRAATWCSEDAEVRRRDRGERLLGSRGVRGGGGHAEPRSRGGLALRGSWRCGDLDRKSTRLNSSHVKISYAV